MAEPRVMSTVEVVNLADYMDEQQTLDLDCLNEIGFIISNRARVKWYFTGIERMSPRSTVFMLNFEKKDERMD